MNSENDTLMENHPENPAPVRSKYRHADAVPGSLEHRFLSALQQHNLVSRNAMLIVRRDAAYDPMKSMTRAWWTVWSSGSSELDGTPLRVPPAPPPEPPDPEEAADGAPSISASRERPPL